MAQRSMLAVRIHAFGGPDAMVLDTVSVPEPAATQVLIRVEASGVNWADTIRRSGGFYPMPTVLPFTVGGEFYGTIEALGSQASRFRVGDKVFAFNNGGGYAQYALAEDAALIAAPAGLDPEAGLALMVQGLSAIAILDETVTVKPGHSVFVQGAAGGLGVIALQLARIYGATTVIAAASSPEKAALVRRYGADCVVDTSQDGWTDTLLAATGGKGVDIVFEMTGGKVFRESAYALAPFGHIVIYGLASNEPPVLDFHRLLPRNVSVHTFYMASFLAWPGFADAKMAKLAGFVADGRLRLHVGGRFRLDEAPKVHRMMEARQTAGKLLFAPHD